MASGFFKRAMVYLGLVDDEYEDYEDYEPRVSVEPAPQLPGGARRRRRGRAHLRRWPRAPSGRMSRDESTARP